MSDGVVEIYTDGACRGNPGPGGWGALLRANGAEKELYGGEAGDHQQPHGADGRDPRARGAEAPQPCQAVHRLQYVMKGIQTWIHDWKRRGWKTADKKPVKNEDLWRQLEAVANKHEVEWHWVKGHAGHPENERADALANKGIPADETDRP